MRLSDAAGRRVLSRASAEEIGSLRHVAIDVPRRRIAALHVAGRRSKALLLDWADIVGFGPDGIVAASEEVLRPPADERERAVVDGDLQVLDRLVLDERGDARGEVTDLLFDEGSGEVQAIVTSDGEHPADRLRAIGPYCVIVAADPR